jgi:hypothetical protein
VALAGAGDPIPGAERPGLLPLADWRSLALAPRMDETLEPTDGDPGDAALLAAVSARDPGPYPALRAGDLIVLPAAGRSRTRLRAVQCAATDPVSFALLSGERVARFPDVPGWSALDSALRAVAERRAWLATGAPTKAGVELGSLFAAARAAQFLESVEAGAPELPLSAAETARRLPADDGAVAEEALEHYLDFARHDTAPPAHVLRAMRELVGRHFAYADSASGPAAGARST